MADRIISCRDVLPDVLIIVGSVPIVGAFFAANVLVIGGRVELQPAIALVGIA